MKIVDTNVLLEYPRIVEKENDLVIHIRVLKELDNLKNRKETAKKARKASNLILKNKDKLHFEDGQHEEAYTDDALIKCAEKRYSILTNDINLLIQCDLKGIEASTYSYLDDDYTGIRRLYVGKDDNSISDVYSGINNLNLCDNEFVLILDTDGHVVGQFQNKKGTLVNLPYKFISGTTYSDIIKARNPEQQLLIDALYDESNTIIHATGTFGTGKSFLLTSYALQQLEEGKIDKIVFVPNNAQNENTRELGALPGDLFEKEVAYMGTLVDIVGDMMEVKRLCDENQIEIMPISLARGRNLKNCIIIVNEAQNLTGDHIKLLIARCAENARIFFDGDIKQSDKEVFREKSGLKLLTHLKDSEEFADIFSMVKLESIERSKTARAAEYLDKIQ